MHPQAQTTAAFAQLVLDRYRTRVEAGRTRLGRPLTFAEKILIAHLADPLASPDGYVAFRPDRVAMQDATAQMALLQFMTSGRDEVAVPSTVHCDHLIAARLSGEQDLAEAIDQNREVYNFLATASDRYGIGFWQPGSGIIHQVVLEQYAFPGSMMIGTDSHTPNAGGLGMIAIGVGGADAVDVMVDSPFTLAWPRRIGIQLNGRCSGWTSPKDIILAVAQLLTVKGATGAIVEYFGPGANSLSATGRATICNMGAEIGATTSLFPFDQHGVAYLKRTGRTELADITEGFLDELQPDPEVLANPAQYYDEFYTLDLSSLSPQVVGPHTPDLGRSVSELGVQVREHGWPTQLAACLVGSCTNSSYEDLTRAASVARQALAKGQRAVVPLYVTPGSERTRLTLERDGILGDLEAIGATILANACGPCIGQWKRSDIKPGDVNSILCSYNRNFPRRNDGNAATLSFIASPEVVVAYSLVGTLDFDPTTHPIDGELLDEPTGLELPPDELSASFTGFVPPTRTAEVLIDPDSERLQVLTPFAPWDGEDLNDLVVLMKAEGKCTTDHISAAGPWLRYRGHLDNISQNLFLGVNNAFTDTPGTGIDSYTEDRLPLPDLARSYRKRNISWIAVGDENYGEGSSREHAAMQPRHLGARAVLARSFARIHETNLKKQGLLPLTFMNPADYDRIQPLDTITLTDLASLAPGVPVLAILRHRDGSTETIACNHTFDAEQLQWFRAGSALNALRLAPNNTQTD